MTRCSSGESNEVSTLGEQVRLLSPRPTCTKCGTELEERERMFHWRGTFLPGHVCVPCNALYEIDNNFTNHVRDHQ